MPDDKTTIKCPECGYEINVNEILYHQLDEKLRVEYNTKLSEQKKEYQQKFDKLSKEREKLEEERSNITQAISDGVNEKLKLEKQKIEKTIRKSIEEEKKDEIESYKNELKEKTEQTKELNRYKAELERTKREKEELKEKIILEQEQKFTERLNEEKGKIKKLEEEKNQFKISEKEQIIEQLKKQLSEAQRKAEQNSTQLKGEVQEIGIETHLKENFPLDSIEEIKKGARGADILQTVNTRTHQNCGTIYYESKRTKDFQLSWIEKFKTDMREKGAEIGVLVTENLPKDMERMGKRDGIWICTYEEFKGLCFALRESIIQLSNVLVAQENKTDKMSMLYNYLTSNEFRMQIEAIVEGFTQMHEDLEKEKRAIEGLWKKREKQIEKVLLNTNHMFNSVKGIAGSAIGSVKALELPEAL